MKELARLVELTEPFQRGRPGEYQVTVARHPLDRRRRLPFHLAPSFHGLEHPQPDQHLPAFVGVEQRSQQIYPTGIADSKAEFRLVGPGVESSRAGQLRL